MNPLDPSTHFKTQSEICLDQFSCAPLMQQGMRGEVKRVNRGCRMMENERH